MKKPFLALVIVVFSFNQLVAQESAFAKGDKVLNIGLGLGTTLYTGSYYKMGIPPLSASYELGVKDNILEKGSLGVGGYLGFSSYKWEYSGWNFKYLDFIIGARGNFHYPLINKLDTYSGLFLGYDISTSKETGTPIYGNNYNTSSGGIVYAWFVGARYYFKDTVGVMAELGYGITYLNLGICLKL